MNENLSFLNGRTVKEVVKDDFGYIFKFEDGSAMEINIHTKNEIKVMNHNFVEDGNLSE